MMYGLPKSLTVCGSEYEIRSDYRAVLDICAALSDNELNEQEKACAALDIFYPAFSEMPVEHYQEALEQCFWFINCGEEQRDQRTPKLMDWEQDFRYIVAPVNRVLGKEIRDIPYLHWWTFISAYYEIGDCTFAQIVRIRDKKARGRALDNQDQEWYRRNRSLVDLKTHYTQKDEDIFDAWVGKKEPP